MTEIPASLADLDESATIAPADDALDLTEEPMAVRSLTEAIIDGRLPEVYIRGDQLVHVSAGQEGVTTRDLDPALLRRLIADNLLCTKRTKIGVLGALPMPITCQAILALPHWPKVPRLRGTATFPVPLPDGTLLQRPGYDPGSGLFLREGMGMRPVPEQPQKAEVRTARGFLLDKFLGDFPWTSAADLANGAAVMFTPLMRELVDDVFPFPYVTAPERGSGKTLFAALVKILYGGSMRILPRKEDEVEKTIISALRSASPVIIFDNVPQDATIRSPALAAVLTMRHYTGRVLGSSRDGTWPNDRLWMATGTNVALGGDFAQRSVRLAMDYGKPNPDQRKGFKIPEIERWTAVNRGDVLWNLLVLVRAWQAAGAPRDKQRVMRGFTPWAEVLGGLLAFLGIDGFLANRDDVVGQDEEGAEMAVFFQALRSRYGTGGRTCRQILDDAAADRYLEDALPSTLDGGKHTPRSLGKLLGNQTGKWYGNPLLTVRAKIDSKGINWWRVEGAVTLASPAPH